MPSRESTLIDTAQRIGAFIDDNAALLGPNVAPSRKTLDDAIAQLNAMAITQSGGVIAAKGATVRRRALRTSLRTGFMKPVADVAKLKLSDDPKFHAMTMPVKQSASTPLVVAAHAMADAAEPHAAVFTEAGLPDDFVPQLRTAADAVTASLDGRVQQTAASRSATASLNAQETRIRNLFRLINELVLPKLGTNVVLLAKWKAVKAIQPLTTPATPSVATAPASTSRAATPVDPMPVVNTPVVTAPAPTAQAATPPAATTPAATAPVVPTPDVTTPAAAAAMTQAGSAAALPTPVPAPTPAATESAGSPTA